MPLSISATFPLGYYQGKDTAGMPEELPTPLRLFLALSAGAYALERLEGQNTTGELSQEDSDIFAWLERHPPAAIEIPGHLLSTSDAISYRNKGCIDKAADRSKATTTPFCRSFVNGPIVWFWDGFPMNGLRRLEDIAAQVPYLGEAECPVILEVRKAQTGTEAWTRTQPSFDALAFSVPDRGRGAELQQAYQLHNKKAMDKPPTHSTQEEENPLQITSTCVSTAYYQCAAKMADVPKAPWTVGYVLRTEGAHLGEETYTSWATCLHRAMARYLGDELPRVMQRATGTRAPANGLAIQIIPAYLPVRAEYQDEDAGDSLMVMLPTGTSAEDERLILGALTRISHLYCHEFGELKVTFTGEQVNLRRFWTPVDKGYRRLFQTMPLFVPNSRPPTSRSLGNHQWTLADDARVAVGYVWRDAFGSILKGDAGRKELSRSVLDSGVGVYGCRVVPKQNIRRYIHRTNRGSFLIGASATLDISCLGCDEALIAIGQTRHFGGGLLLPLDVPIATGLREGLLIEGNEHVRDNR